MPYTKQCHVCEEMFSANRQDARYCSAACRQRAVRERKSDQLESEFERIRDINHVAAPELYYILAVGGEKAARAAVKLFWIAANMQAPGVISVTLADGTDTAIAATVTPASVTDTTRSKPVTPASVADTTRSKPPESITPDDCRLLLRRMAPAKQDLLWRARSGELMTQPMGWHIDDLAKQGYLLKADNGWQLTKLGLVLAQHIDQGGDGVADWTRSMIREARKK